MFGTIRMRIKSTSPVFGYFTQNATGSRAVRNTASFYIRNVMTGMKKAPEERTDNEQKVLDDVFSAIDRLNERRLSKKPDSTVIPYPTPEKWMLSYSVLDAVMKLTKNEAYYSCTPQVNQQAIRKTCKSWKGYFRLLQAWKKNPSMLKGKPRIPGYIREEMTTAHFTNQVCRCEKKDGRLYLVFTNYGRFCVGPETLVPGKFLKAEVKPFHGDFLLLLTYETDREEPKLPDCPERILGIDVGLANFLACADNTGNAPFLVKGGWIKSLNRQFNKRKAFLTSELDQAENARSSKNASANRDNDSSGSHRKKRTSSHNLQTLSGKRDDRMRDFFYKTAWLVCRKCMERKINVIVIGHNKDQKQEIGIGKVNNQNFVSIPVTQFIACLKHVACACGIPVVEREESYTSKANILNLDDIPTYGENGAASAVFTGTRKQRGLYCADDGQKINADINGACNILRKEYPHAFDGVDMTYLTETTEVYTGEQVLGIKHREGGKPHFRKSEKRSAWNKVAA